AKFITMVYLTVEPGTGEILAASAGHPAPLVVSSRGDVEQLRVRGLALGVDSGQTYVERRSSLEPGGALVVYTDGVVEARRDGELYGLERLAEGTRAARGPSAEEIARPGIEDCRSFARDLAADCAVGLIQ